MAGGGFCGYRLKFWLSYGYRLIYFITVNYFLPYLRLTFLRLSTKFLDVLRLSVNGIEDPLITANSMINRKSVLTTIKYINRPNYSRRYLNKLFSL